MVLTLAPNLKDKILLECCQPSVVQRVPTCKLNYALELRLQETADQVNSRVEARRKERAARGSRDSVEAIHSYFIPFSLKNQICQLICCIYLPFPWVCRSPKRKMHMMKRILLTIMPRTVNLHHHRRSNK